MCRMSLGLFFLRTYCGFCKGTSLFFAIFWAFSLESFFACNCLRLCCFVLYCRDFFIWNFLFFWVEWGFCNGTLFFYTLWLPLFCFFLRRMGLRRRYPFLLILDCSLTSEFFRRNFVVVFFAQNGASASSKEICFSRRMRLLQKGFVFFFTSLGLLQGNFAILLALGLWNFVYLRRTGLWQWYAVF